MQANYMQAAQIIGKGSTATDIIRVVGSNFRDSRHLYFTVDQIVRWYNNTK
jgi:hypothetical protein